jgi:hypothetical protein
MRARVAALAVAATAAALGGCGENRQEPVTVAEPPRLAPADARRILKVRERVRDYCDRVSDYLAGRRGPPTGAELAAVSRQLDRLAALARAHPSAVNESGVSARLALGDIAEDLEGTNCDDRLVRRIDRVLPELPGR